LKFQALTFILAAIAISACTEQFDPSHSREMLEEERLIANTKQASLTEDGKLPGEAKPVEFKADEVYAQLCSSCHGMDGAANTAGAMALNPRPRAFTDKQWQASVSDERIYKVLKEGGMAVGLSATMVSFAGILDSDEKLNAMVKQVRSYGK
jgi:cytochrome c553